MSGKTTLDNTLIDQLLSQFHRDGEPIEAAQSVIDLDAYNTVMDGGRTPLHLAANSACAEAVQLLLEAGADVNAQDEDGATPLNSLCTRGPNDLNYPKDIEVFKLLMSLPHLDPNIPDKHGETPLMNIINTSEWDEAIPMLMDDPRVNLQYVSQYDRSALSTAQEPKMKVEVQKRMNKRKTFTKPAPPSAYKKGSVNTAAKPTLNKDFAEKIVDNFNGRGGDAVTAANKVIQLGIVNVPLLGRVDFQPLHLAISNKSPQAVQLLLNAGANPNALGMFANTPLNACVRHLRDNYYTTDKYEAYTGMLKALLSNVHVDPNLADSVGDTPLHHVVTLPAWKEGVQMLLNDSRVDFNRKNKNGKTAMADANDDWVQMELQKRIMAGKTPTKPVPWD